MAAPLSILGQHKANVAAEKRAAVQELERRLAAAAVALGGLFILFGSAARDELRYDSDVDLLLNFPDEMSTAAAWGVAEDACSALKLECDITPIGSCSPAFLDHVMKEARSIP